MLQKGQGKSNAGAPLGQAELSCTYQQWQVQKHRVQSWLLQADGSMQSESDTSQLGQPCCTFAHSLGSVWAMELMQRFLCVCDSAFLWNGRLFRLPTHPAFGKMYSATAQSSRERELSCCKQQTSIHAGRAGGSAECAWIQCSWDPDTAVCELYQEDTIEPLPKFSTCIE